jgi:hypothetical protein
VALVAPPLVFVTAVGIVLRLADVGALLRAAMVFLVQSAVAILTVELGNYVQHYGLERGRSRLDAERFERVQLRHSWIATCLHSTFTCPDLHDIRITTSSPLCRSALCARSSPRRPICRSIRLLFSLLDYRMDALSLLFDHGCAIR